MKIKTIIVALPEKVGEVDYTGLSVPKDAKMISTATYTVSGTKHFLAVTFISD